MFEFLDKTLFFVQMAAPVLEFMGGCGKYVAS
jgi:hypothetical protein